MARNPNNRLKLAGELLESLLGYSGAAQRPRQTIHLMR